MRRRRAAGLAVAQRAESQEACFLAGDDYRSFLERQGLPRTAGAIVDEDGGTLGTHDGFWRFTPGQRRGLGVSAAEPLYALHTDSRTNTVVAGPRAALARTRVSARGRLYSPASRVEAKLRYRSPAVGAEVETTATGFRLDARRARLRRRPRTGRRALRRRRRRRFRIGHVGPG